MYQRRYAREVLVRFEMNIKFIMLGTKLSKTNEGTKVEATLYTKVVGNCMEQVSLVDLYLVLLNLIDLQQKEY